MATTIEQQIYRQKVREDSLISYMKDSPRHVDHVSNNVRDDSEESIHVSNEEITQVMELNGIMDSYNEEAQYREGFDI